MSFWRGITMLWFLVLIAPTVRSQFFDQFDVQMDQEWPSCSELRTMWLNLRKIAAMGELTNEIPLIPRELMDSAYLNMKSPQRGRHKNVGRRITINENQMLHQLEDLNNIERSIFSNDLRSSHEPSSLNPITSKIETPDKSLNPTISGFFDDLKDDFPKIDKQLLTPDVETNRKTDNGIARIDLLAYPSRGSSPFIQNSGFSNTNDLSSGTASFQPQWGIKDEAGLFGGFSDEGSVSRRVKSSGWHDVLKKPHAPVGDSGKISCDAIENKKCSRNEHCLCNGWASSICVSGGCHIVTSRDSGDVMDFGGAWHNGPFSISKLGLSNRRKRRAARSTIM